MQSRLKPTQPLPCQRGSPTSLDCGIDDGGAETLKFKPSWFFRVVVFYETASPNLNVPRLSIRNKAPESRVWHHVSYHDSTWMHINACWMSLHADRVCPGLPVVCVVAQWVRNVWPLTLPVRFILLSALSVSGHKRVCLSCSSDEMSLLFLLTWFCSSLLTKNSREVW